MIVLVKGILNKVCVLFLGMLLSFQAWGIDDPNIYLFNENDVFPSLNISSAESDSEENSQKDQESQSQDEGDTLAEGLYRDLQSLRFDAQDYILCHTDLKNVYLKCNEIYKALLLMRENIIMAGSELITSEQRHYFNIYFRSHADAIPMILSINSSESMMGTDNKKVLLPEGLSILIPTVKPIVEATRLLSIITAENRIAAQNIIDGFIPKIVDVLFHVSIEANKVLSLIHKVAQKIEATEDKLVETLIK